MTEKEKAKQLYDKYYHHSNGTVINIVWGDTEQYESSEVRRRNTKACAIYAVDLMLTEFKDIEFNYGYELIDVLDYWGKVKQELENM